MKGNALFSKLFLVDRFFTIAIRKKRDSEKDKRFAAEYILPATRSKWAADPMLVDAGNKTYLFYEAVIGDKGHIEVAEVLDDCTLGEPMVILKGDCHYSYPFVFRYENTWYMIPESSAATEVQLYRAEVFPEKWELCSILLHEKTVDTTVFEQNGQLFLLTFFLVAGSERVIPHAYKMALDGENAKLTEVAWNEYDELRVRGAGPVFPVGDKLYRPAQISQEQRYGDCLAFYRIDMGDSYHESFVGELLVSDLTTSGYYVDGLHTYCASKRFEVIDIRCGVIDYLKPVHKFWSILRG